MQQVLRNMLGRPELEEVHREILQALQGPDGTSLPELLVTLADMGLVVDQAQEVEVARQQLKQAAEVSPAYLCGATRVLTGADVCPPAGAGGGGGGRTSMPRACTRITQMLQEMRQGARTLLQLGPA